jgi:hypothetical protein
MSMVETTTVTEGLPQGSEPEGTTPETQPTESVPTYKVNVHGVEIEATVDELIEGFMLKADYTRKTQTLAEQRRALEEAQTLAAALEQDPEETLKFLAKQYGVSALDVEDDEYQDPADQKLKALERELQALKQAEIRRAIDAEVSELRSSYPVSEDQLEDIFAHAAKKGVDLKSAYRDLFFDEHMEALAKLKQRFSTESAAEEAKKKAAVVHLGTSTTSAATPAPAADRKLSVREAYELALQGIRVDQ